jgi:hypothetical protein
MKTETLSDGTIVHRYLEDSLKGRVVVTLVPGPIPNLYLAHREYHSDATEADSVYAAPVQLTKVEWIRKEQKDRGEVLPDGTRKPADLSSLRK